MMKRRNAASEATLTLPPSMPRPVVSLAASMVPTVAVVVVTAIAGPGQY